jgi:hypothetical protein
MNDEDTADAAGIEVQIEIAERRRMRRGDRGGGAGDERGEKTKEEGRFRGPP